MLRFRFWVLAVVFLAGAFSVVAFGQSPFAKWGRGGGAAAKVFGAPPARVFHEDYDGPPAVGEALSHVPNLAALSPGNRTHHVRIDVVAQEIEIAPGVRYQAWTFGGSVPGPVVHVREGDRIVFTMKNRSASKVTVTEPSATASAFLAGVAGDDLQKPQPAIMPMPHSMDFHAGTVAANDKWRIIQPDDSIEFEWVANYPGVFLYHCGMAPVLMHLSMGQYGVVVVSPKNGYPTDDEVAREYVVVQSEFYLKEGADETFAFDGDAAASRQPSHVAFNGHVQALTKHPLVANAGERVRLYFNNAGPSSGSSLHVVGAIFDRVFYEGNPRNDFAGMQTAYFGASSGGVLEFIAPEEGTYVLVDHEFADAQRGAVGQILVRSPSGQITRMPAMMPH
jgi:nitrite reductase (NO-forming)